MKLQEYLKEYGVTKTHIARRLDVSAVAVDNWAKGRNMPSPPKILEIEKLTDGKVMLADWVAK